MGLRHGRDIRVAWQDGQGWRKGGKLSIRDVNKGRVKTAMAGVRLAVRVDICRKMKAVVVALLLLVAPLSAQELSGLARLEPGGSAITDAGEAVTVRLGLSQAVPWRVRVLDAPPRVVMDFREVDWTGIDGVPSTSVRVAEVRAGAFRPGWSRLVMGLSEPMVVARAGMLTGDGVAVEVTLEPASQADFAARAALPEPADWALPDAVDLPKPAVRGTGPVIVVLDPGHGGIDPGAERDGETEADLMLTFAREFKEELLRDGGFAVVMTRDEDVFVPLEARISVARAAGAHVFLSLHADALEEGEAVGATIYTLAEDAGDEAAEALAERHDRDDLLAGIDLSATDDLVATVLMDMARTETAPRTERLAGALEQAIKAADLRMHRVPQQRAGFSVLKSPDIPSALVELGFLSSERDLARLMDDNWRRAMATALVAGLKSWAAEDAALAALRK
jgi:N-acetylmuramoyl-L-alanine amidase